MCDQIAGDVYYCPENKRLFAVYSRIDDGFICSGFARFVDDAKTAKDRQLLSPSFVGKCKKMSACLDENPELEPHHLGWMVKG